MWRGCGGDVGGGRARRRQPAHHHRVVLVHVVEGARLEEQHHVEQVLLELPVLPLAWRELGHTLRRDEQRRRVVAGRPFTHALRVAQVLAPPEAAAPTPCSAARRLRRRGPGRRRRGGGAWRRPHRRAQRGARRRRGGRRRRRTGRLRRGRAALGHGHVPLLRVLRERRRDVGHLGVLGGGGRHPGDDASHGGPLRRGRPLHRGGWLPRGGWVRRGGSRRVAGGEGGATLSAKVGGGPCRGSLAVRAARGRR